VRQERLVQAHARSEGFPTAPREAEGGVIGCNSTGDIVALSFSCVEKWLDRKSGNISHCIIIRYEYKVRWHLGYTLVVIHNSSWWLLWFGVHVSRTRAKSAALTKFHPTGDHSPLLIYVSCRPVHCGWTGNACLSICQTRARCSVSTARRRLGVSSTLEGTS
jgi:hypothetical protein